MAKSYDENVRHFLDKSAEKGLSYTLYKALSVVPAALGHLIDTILALDGINQVKDNHFVGPFGILLGIIPLVVGYLLGHIIDIILKIPCYFGYYVIDRPLAWALHNSRTPIPFDNLVNVSWVLTPINMYLIRFTNNTPPQMKGGFGFILGIIPHIALYIVIRTASIFTSLVDVIINNTCEGISYLYSLDYDPVPPILQKAAIDPPYGPFSDYSGYSGSFDFNGANSSQPEGSPAPGAAYSQAGANVNPEAAAEGSGSKPTKRKKGPRVQRPPEREEIDERNEPDLFKVSERKLDLFAELGITKEEYVAEAERIAETNKAAAGDNDKTVSTQSGKVKKAYRVISIQCHPDKVKVKTKDENLQRLAVEKFARVETAHKILEDTSSLQAMKYVYFYEQNQGVLQSPLSIDPLINLTPAATSLAPSPSEPPRREASPKPVATTERPAVAAVPAANAASVSFSPAPAANPGWRAPSEFPVPPGAHPQSFLASSRREIEKSPPLERRDLAAHSAESNASTTSSAPRGEEQTARSFRRKAKPPADQKRGSAASTTTPLGYTHQ
jgi:curved DNA-binding protein CbpA